MAVPQKTQKEAECERNVSRHKNSRKTQKNEMIFNLFLTASQDLRLFEFFALNTRSMAHVLHLRAFRSRFCTHFFRMELTFFQTPLPRAVQYFLHRWDPARRIRFLHIARPHSRRKTQRLFWRPAVKKSSQKSRDRAVTASSRSGNGDLVALRQ